MSSTKLFEKFIFNNKAEIKNRLVITPITIAQSTTDGSINDEEREYLKQRATNVGLYIYGATEVSPEAIDIASRPRALNEKDLQSLTERANIIKSQGAKALIQIDHRGSFANIDFSGLSPVAPSADTAIEELKSKGFYSEKNKTHELTDEEIKRIIEDFGKATELCIKAGFDGVEIHGANNYLLQQFYSRHYNKRTDDWGGSDEKRMDFPLRIIDTVCKVREKNNIPEFIIGYRLSPEEPFEDGITMTETLKLVRALVNKPIQYISISQKNYFQKARRGEGAGTERLKLIHKEIEGKMALIGVGGLKSVSDFNSAVNSGFSELIGAGIASMLNPDLGILLEKDGEKLKLEIDPEHPEYYKIAPDLWKWCLMGLEWLPPVKGKPQKKEEDK